MRTLRVIAIIYAVLCVGALLLIPIGAYGLFGTDPEPLGAVFAIFLALPWSMGLEVIGEPGPLRAALFLGLCMALNVAILLWVARWLGRRRNTGALPD